MKRRSFLLKNGTLLASPLFISSAKYLHKKPKKIKPRRLKKGDTVGLITPGSFIEDESLETAIKNLEGMGFKIQLSKNIRAQLGFIAGTDEQRLHDLHWAFSNKELNTVWCARGGYGCSRLLPFINYNLIRKNPKIFIGYSDVTALVNAFYIKTGLVSFHGPVAASDFTDYTKEHLIAVLMDGKINHVIQLAPTEQAIGRKLGLNMKTVSGELVGGNLSLLAATAGTPYAPDFKNKIALIEDIGEAPYRIDRMLTQLRQTSNLGKACAIALGNFSDCDSDKPNSLTLEETLRGRLDFKGVPVAYEFPFGHISDHCTLPIGARARLNTHEMTIELLESAVL